MSGRWPRRGTQEVLFGVIGLVVALVIPVAWAAPGWSTSYEDTFAGSALDSAKWDTSLATSGARWCPDTPSSTTGTWTDPAISGCQGVVQAAPYGSIDVSNGAASFSAGVIRAFPFVFRGRSNVASLFPRNGKFVLEVRMRYDSLGDNGAGVVASALADGTPVGGFPFGQPPVFQVWAGTGAFGLRASSVGGEVQVDNPTDWHVYRLEYIGRAYTLWVDDVLRVGPTSSKVRPTALWIGNPALTHWGLYDWSDFTIDYIRILVSDTGNS